jgi:sodium transport system permease protein
MAMGLDTTAGEKERGSLASLLVNQVPRTSIAVGKILFVVTSGLINSSASALGILAAFRINASLFGITEFGAAGALSALGIVSLFLVLVVGSGIAASTIVLLGSMARNLKEATGYIMPIYILVIVAGVATMGMDTAENLVLYLIPVVNVIFSLKGIILSQITVLQLLITLLVDLGLIAGLAYLTSRLYNTERVLNTVT